MRRLRSSVLALVAVIGFAACRDERPAAAPFVPADDGRTATAGPSAADLANPNQPSGQGLITPWLEVKDGRIRTPDGKPWHGRGANLHDTRSCDACTWEPPHIEEVKRRVDELVDGWHANFVRLLLESYPDDGQAKVGNRRTHYKNVLQDGDYFRDVMQIIGHIGSKKGVYVLVSLWQDPSFSPLGWPTPKTQAIWKRLALTLKDMPFVMFGLVNEPQKNDDGKLDHEVWTAMNDTVLAIRSVERKEHPHIITVQGTREWGRSLDYYMSHPITAGGGVNIAYETHVYNRPARFDELVGGPSKKLPVIIGEFGALQNKDITMYPDDCEKLMDLAESLDVPWLAWTFHSECPPNLIVEKKGGCGVGQSLEPSAWGKIVKGRLARPW